MERLSQSMRKLRNTLRVRTRTRYVLHRARIVFSFATGYLKFRCWQILYARGRTLIGIVLIEHIGDIVAAEPIVRSIRQQNPTARLIWLVRKRYRELVSCNPDIDRPIIVTCLTETMWWAKAKVFHRVIQLHFPGRCCVRCHEPLQPEFDAPVVTHDNYFNHGTLLTCMSLTAGIPVPDEAPRVYIGKEDKDHIDRLGLPNNFIAIHCISNDPAKDWPEDKWRSLVTQVSEGLGLATLEVGLRSIFRSALPIDVTDLTNKLSILQTAELIRRSRLFVGIDSGPAHLANAVRTPGVILLGRYSQFESYTPYSGDYGNGRLATLVRCEGQASNISVALVLTAIRDRIQLQNGVLENTRATGRATTKRP